MKKDNNTTASINEDALERIILKMEKLSSLCHVCAAAYDNEKAYSIVNEDDTTMAFYHIADQVEAISAELATLLWDKKVKDQEEKAANQSEKR